MLLSFASWFLQLTSNFLQRSTMIFNIKGRLTAFHHPIVMGIVNITNDSFFPASRVERNEDIINRVGNMLEAGASIIDIGACSTRPGSDPVSVEHEMQRLASVLGAIRNAFPDILISVDTFRADVAAMAVNEFGVDIINDVGGGDTDPEMPATVAKLKVPYVLTHCGNHFSDNDSAVVQNIIEEVMTFFGNKLTQLQLMGVADIILDPGIGFGKTPAENFTLLRDLDIIKSMFGRPILIGVSRKSLITHTLECGANEALNGTTALNAIALSKGASILRVHDVKEAVETVILVDRVYGRG